ncbi:hypothetical protein JKP88DRAFT_4647 [Tribonema minus]|uniref:Uncharacterized protein n=1 Tax=Tribonema minus TaxID=303371 RepID=A0A836CMT0_9STRA|nr:hypothetical protein JKP88DRAFT_4647 [Tribonema minus]
MRQHDATLERLQPRASESASSACALSKIAVVVIVLQSSFTPVWTLAVPEAPASSPALLSRGMKLPLPSDTQSALDAMNKNTNTTLRQEVEALREDMAAMQQHVGHMQGQLADLKQGMHDVKTDTESLRPLALDVAYVKGLVMSCTVMVALILLAMVVVVLIEIMESY